MAHVRYDWQTKQDVLVDYEPEFGYGTQPTNKKNNLSPKHRNRIKRQIKRAQNEKRKLEKKMVH